MFGSLKDIMTELELLALFTAAAIHDYDHPVRRIAYYILKLLLNLEQFRKSI